MKKLLILLSLFQFNQLQAQDNPVIKFKDTTYDFGDIREENGPVVHEFVFTNTSTEPLTVLRVNASCGCTTPGWSKEPIPPGQNGFVKAQYDPRGRPGFFQKNLTVVTDQGEPVVLFIKGRVTPKDSPIVTEFPAQQGSLRFKTNSLNLGKVYINREPVTHEFTVYNESDKPITTKPVDNLPKHIDLKIVPDVIAAGERALMRVTYHAKLKNAYGFQTDHILVPTDDSQTPLKSFSIYAMIEEYFPPMSAEELSKAPQLQIDQLSHDFGKIKSNARIEKTFTVSNTGKSKLVLRDIQANCTCVELSIDKKELKAGESTTLKVVFDANGRRANQQKALTIYSNDPRNAVQRITLNAYVEAN